MSNAKPSRNDKHDKVFKILIAVETALGIIWLLTKIWSEVMSVLI